jgi:hypothetical protein
MKQIITAILTTSLVYPTLQTTAIATPANLYTQTQISTKTVEQISPFDLAFVAYQGNLKHQGIPSYGALIDAISFGKVTAQKVMQAAVNDNRLPAEILTDRSYRSALQTQLYNLITID